MTSRQLTIEPIGYVRTAIKFKDEAPRQPRASGGASGRIELLSGRNYEHALLDIEGWDHIWVLFWFHHNAGWRPKVLPPRSVSGRKGVFATRSPHRPNPIGLSAVRLERIEGLTLHVHDIDMLDGTPVLDLKPYVAYTDAIADARNGWLDGHAGGAADPIAAFDVQWDEPAAEQAAWVEARTGLALRARVTSTLALGPEPQPYRRIRRDGEGFVLAVKEWRARFSVEGRRVRVHEIRSGYRDSQLSGANRCDADLSAHREFRAMQSSARSCGARAETERKHVRRVLAAAGRRRTLLARRRSRSRSIDYSKLEIKTTDFGHGVYLLGWQGGDSLILVGDDGVLLVDTSVAPMGDKIKAAIAKVSNKPIKWVVNTHAHADHFGANEAMAKDGALIVAHEGLRERMAKGQYLAAFNQTIPPSPPAALPKVTYADAMTLHFDGETVELVHVPECAHRQRHARALQASERDPCERHVRRRRRAIPSSTCPRAARSPG